MRPTTVFPFVLCLPFLLSAHCHHPAFLVFPPYIPTPHTLFAPQTLQTVLHTLHDHTHYHRSSSYNSTSCSCSACTHSATAFPLYARHLIHAMSFSHHYFHHLPPACLVGDCTLLLRLPFLLNHCLPHTVWRLSARTARFRDSIPYVHTTTTTTCTYRGLRFQTTTHRSTLPFRFFTHRPHAIYYRTATCTYCYLPPYTPPPFPTYNYTTVPVALRLPPCTAFWFHTVVHYTVLFTTVTYSFLLCSSTRVR